MEATENQKRQDRIIKSFFVGLFEEMKNQKPREELVNIFGESLTEMEIALYALKKAKKSASEAGTSKAQGDE